MHQFYARVRGLVLDIRNFTTFSEGRVAEEVVAYLNTLWTFMVRTVNEHHGIVNKFLGDGFLAVFGAPVSTGNDCANALAAARHILREIDELTEAGRLLPTRIGIALHAGEAVVGNVGSAERKEYTVIGDVVNVAFRIERLNKQLGSTFLVSRCGASGNPRHALRRSSEFDFHPGPSGTGADLSVVLIRVRRRRAEKAGRALP